jgi:hypothetical protein
MPADNKAFGSNNTANQFSTIHPTYQISIITTSITSSSSFLSQEVEQETSNQFW